MSGEATQKGSGVREVRLGVLVVEDDPLEARALERIITAPLEPVVVSSVAEARSALASESSLVGAIVDIGLPDGSGIEVVRLLRQELGPIPVLILTGILEPGLVNEAHALRAEYVCKPAVEAVSGFLHRLVHGEKQAVSPAQLRRARATLGLTGREASILELAAQGVPRGYLAQELGVSENTLKKYIGTLLAKAHCNSLAELLWCLRSGGGVFAATPRAENAGTPRPPRGGSHRG